MVESPAVPVEVVVYSKPRCRLCDELKTKLQRLRLRVPFEWREVNILENPAAYQAYQDEIPVVFVNGKKAFKFYLDEKQFLKQLGHAQR